MHPFGSVDCVYKLQSKKLIPSLGLIGETKYVVVMLGEEQGCESNEVFTERFLFFPLSDNIVFKRSCLY